MSWYQLIQLLAELPTALLIVGVALIRARSSTLLRYRLICRVFSVLLEGDTLSRLHNSNAMFPRPAR
jgi:hypothetical protein